MFSAGSEVCRMADFGIAVSEPLVSRGSLFSKPQKMHAVV